MAPGPRAAPRGQRAADSRQLAAVSGQRQRPRAAGSGQPAVGSGQRGWERFGGERWWGWKEGLRPHHTEANIRLILSLTAAIEFWALQSSGGLCTQVVGSAIECWLLQSTAGLSTRVLRSSLKRWAVYSIGGLRSLVLASAIECWAMHWSGGLCNRV